MLRLALVGDVMLGRLVNDSLRTRPTDRVWGDTLPILAQADWRACNLECVLSDHGRPWNAYPKVFHFRSDARNVAVLQKAGIHAVSIANNHTLDFEHDALLESISTLDAAGIGHAGAGADERRAREPCVPTILGKTIGLIAFTDNEPGWEAGPCVPGLFYVPIDPTDSRAHILFEMIRKTRE